jgi:5-formyltetrahydrofolate cyclo-ligase
MTKEQIRLAIKKERNALSAEDVKAFSEAIQDKLFLSEAYRDCRSLFTYVSFQTEVDTRPIIYDAWSKGKTVYAPRVDDKSMDFYIIHTFDTLIRSKFGVSEPAPEEKLRYQFQKDLEFGDGKLMLLPGLAFDYSGNRIGYGAGYYDRYQNKHITDQFVKVALAYDFQILDGIPASEYDRKADMIITPTRIINCN